MSCPPADDDDICTNCGKAMTVPGLNRSYPPKRDDAGRPICPHCGGFTKTDIKIDFGPGGPYKTARATLAAIERDMWAIFNGDDYDEHDHEYEEDEEYDEDD